MRKRAIVAAAAAGIGAAAAGGQVCPTVEPMLDIGLNEPASHSAIFDEDGAGPSPARLFLSGAFTRAGGEAAAGVARWDGDALSAIDGTPPGVKGAMRTFDNGGGPALYIAGAPGALHRFRGDGWDLLAVPQFAGFDGAPESFAAFDPDGQGPRPPGLFALVHYPGLPLEQDSVLWRYDQEGWARLSGAVPRGMITAYDPDGAGPAAWQLFHIFNVDRANPQRRVGYVRRLHEDHWELIGYTSGADGVGIRDAAAMYFGADRPPVLVVVGGLNAIRHDGNAWVFGDRGAAWDGSAWSPLDGFLVLDEFAAATPVYGQFEGPRLLAAGASRMFGSPAGSAIYEAGAGAGGQYEWSQLNTADADSVTLLREFDPDGAGPRGSQVLLSGELRSVGNPLRAAGPLAVRQPDGEWETLLRGHPGPVESLLVYNDGTGRKLIATGAFADGISRWDGADWGPVGHPISQLKSAGAIAPYRDAAGWALYTVRYRTHGVSDLYRNRLGEPFWTSVGRLVGRTGFARVNIYGMSLHDADGAGPGAPELFMAGDFSRILPWVVSDLARFDGSQWTGITGFHGGEVRAIKSLDDGTGPALYVGGSDLNVGGVPDAQAARWKDGAWELLPDLPPGYIVRDFALDNTAGSYMVVAVLAPVTVPGGAVVRLENGAWVDLNAPAEIDATVARNIQDGNGPSLIVGRHRYDGAAWSRLEPFPDGEVRAISPVFDDGHGPSFFIGGDFETVGGEPAANIARVRLCPAPWASGGCYPNCDGSEAAPVLNASDFTCFLQRYAAGDAWANCDGSDIEPVLNVADFACFVQRFAAGCR